MLEVIRDDGLRKLERELRDQAHNSILTAAKLIAPAIDSNFTAGKFFSLKSIKYIYIIFTILE